MVLVIVSMVNAYLNAFEPVRVVFSVCDIAMSTLHNIVKLPYFELYLSA